MTFSVLFCCSAIFCLALSLQSASAAVPNVIIRPGIKIPAVGVGSCCGSYNISAWIAEGSRHIDTSCAYGSEPDIGAAIRASGIPRDQFFITSKVNTESYGNYSVVADAFQKQVLTPLGTDYVDLLLMHHAGRPQQGFTTPPCWDGSLPASMGTYFHCRIETWTAFQQLRKEGKARAIGVSNFEVRDLQQLFNASQEYPAVNQIETHPYWHTDDIIGFCNQHDIAVEAYAPFADFPRSQMLADPKIAALAQQINRTIGQTVLRYELQKGVDIVIPRSKTPTHMQENIDIFSFQLTASQVDSIDHFPQVKVYATQCQPWC